MIITIIEFLIIGMAAAGVEMMFQRGMFENHFIHRYMVFLIHLHHSGKFGQWISKPLGACCYCHGFWLAVFIHWIFSYTKYQTIDLYTFFNPYIVITLGFWYITTVWILNFGNRTYEMPLTKTEYAIFKRKRFSHPVSRTKNR